MADPKFFKKAGPFTLLQIAEHVGLSVPEGCNPQTSFDDIMSLQTATEKHVSFFDNRKYLPQFETSKAGVCFATADMVSKAPSGMIVLATKYPYKAYGLMAQAFYPEQKSSKTQIHPSAVIEPSAEIGEGCQIGPFVYIGENVKVGAHCRIDSHACITHAIIGKHVKILTGVKIGQEGFGFAIDPTGFTSIPQLGRVIIEDHVEIGANTTIDRGAGPDTFIGHGTRIDNLVQIGHNVHIGPYCVIVAQVGISGSTRLEGQNMLGGQVGLAGHLTIGQNTRIGAKSGVIRDIPANSEYMGFPAINKRDYMRQVIALSRLTSKNEKKND